MSSRREDDVIILIHGHPNLYLSFIFLLFSLIAFWWDTITALKFYDFPKNVWAYNEELGYEIQELCY